MDSSNKYVALITYIPYQPPRSPPTPNLHEHADLKKALTHAQRGTQPRSAGGTEQHEM